MSQLQVISHFRFTHVACLTFSVLLLMISSRRTIHGTLLPRNPLPSPLTLPRCNSESVIALPGIGIQLDSQKAYVLPLWTFRLLCRNPGRRTLFPSSRTTFFIPLSTVRPLGGSGADSVFLHEGLQRWSVRYYLGVLYSVGEPKASSHGMDGHGAVQDTWKVQVTFPVSLLLIEERMMLTLCAEPATSPADST